MKRIYCVLLLMSFCFELRADDVGRLPRMSICLNGRWETAVGDDTMRLPESGWSSSRIPSLPQADEQRPKSMWYRLTLKVPQEWDAPGRQFFLELEKAGHYVAVFANGQKAGEHYGQYSPFEVNLTQAFRLGKENEIAIYVHDASGRFVRPGADISEEFVCNAYRAAAGQPSQRNWIGVVGNITLSWRPATALKDIFVVPSVRQKTIEARIEIVGADEAKEPLTCQATVFDGEKTVLDLPEMEIVPGTNQAVLRAGWPDPVLWGPPPYGEAKLYTLRTELRHQREVVDRQFTRFGFREVWIEGRDVFLNGKKLWMIGSYLTKPSLVLYLNDRRPLAVMVRALQTAGLNTLQGHWDDPGRAFYDVCDEMGVLVVGEFFCDGRPMIQSKADDGWVEWMASTCAEWVRARRGHASIVVWRPTDVPPQNINDFGGEQAFRGRLADEVRRWDGTRPLADNSDIRGYGQPPINRETGEYDDGSRMENEMRNTTQPFLTKEIYTDFRDVENLSKFFQIYYQKSFEGGSTGMIVQYFPLFDWSQSDFAVSWLSQSGPGNRVAGRANAMSRAQELGNWCDPDQPAWLATPFTSLFAELHKKYVGHEPKPFDGPAPGEALISGLPPQTPVFLVPEDPSLVGPKGMLSASDGTAWFAAIQPGHWRIIYPEGEAAVDIVPQKVPPKPGYEHVQRVVIDRK